MLKTFFLAKILRLFFLSSFKQCQIDKRSKVSYGCSLSRVKMGKYSYVGASTGITDCEIGNFCSIGGNCGIGGGLHPIQMVSTSPVFLQGKNFLRKHFASFPYAPSEHVVIGNDVWIGASVYIKSGVKIGTGAIIGAHAVVTKDVEPYSIVAGVPAKKLRNRFDTETINELLKIKWWDWPDEQIKQMSDMFDSPQKLIDSIKNRD